MIARFLIIGCMFALTLPAIGQTVEDQKAQNLEQRVVRLTHADAAEAMELLRSTLSCRVGTDRRTNSVVINGSHEVVEAAVRLLDELDVPTSDDANTSSALVRLREDASDQLMDLIRTQLSRRTDAAFDRETGLLALRGPSKEIQAVREFIAQMEDRAEARERDEQRNRALRVSFFFLIATTDPAQDGGKGVDVGAPTPPALASAIEVLEENGFYNPALLMPLMVHVQSNEAYHLSGRTEVNDMDLRVEINGEAGIHQSGDTAELNVNAVIVEEGEGGSPLFEIGSRLSTRIGDTVVLAASPIAERGRAAALVVRVMPAE